MTLNSVMALILRYFTEFSSFGANYVKVVEDRPKLSATKCSPKNLVSSDMSLMAIFAETTENERIIERHLRDIHPLLDYDASDSQSIRSRFDRSGPTSAIWLQSVRSSACLSVCRTHDPRLKIQHIEMPFALYDRAILHLDARSLCGSWASCYTSVSVGVRSRLLPWSRV